MKATGLNLSTVFYFLQVLVLCFLSGSYSDVEPPPMISEPDDPDKGKMTKAKLGKVFGFNPEVDELHIEGKNEKDKVQNAGSDDKGTDTPKKEDKKSDDKTKDKAEPSKDESFKVPDKDNPGKFVYKAGDKVYTTDDLDKMIKEEFELDAKDLPENVKEKYYNTLMKAKYGENRDTWQKKNTETAQILAEERKKLNDDKTALDQTAENVKQLKSELENKIKDLTKTAKGLSQAEMDKLSDSEQILAKIDQKNAAKELGEVKDELAELDEENEKLEAARVRNIFLRNVIELGENYEELRTNESWANIINKHNNKEEVDTNELIRAQTIYKIIQDATDMGMSPKEYYKVYDFKYKDVLGHITPAEKDKAEQEKKKANKIAEEQKTGDTQPGNSNLPTKSSQKDTAKGDRESALAKMNA